MPENLHERTGMEAATRTIRFTQNAVDRKTNINYFGDQVITTFDSVAERMIAAGVAEEIPGENDLKAMKVADLEKVAEKEGVDLSHAKNKDEKVAALANKEGVK